VNAIELLDQDGAPIKDDIASFDHGADKNVPDYASFSAEPARVQNENF
jgi:hypothetical protein